MNILPQKKLCFNTAYSCVGYYSGHLTVHVELAVETERGRGNQEKPLLYRCRQPAYRSLYIKHK